MSDAEVADHCLYNADGTATQYHVPTLDSILEELKGRCVINLDKFFDWTNEIAACVRKHGMTDQALIKTNQDEKWYAP